MKTQTSIEFLLLLAGVLLVAVVGLYLVRNISSQGKEYLNSSVNTHKNVVNTILNTEI